MSSIKQNLDFIGFCQRKQHGELADRRFLLTVEKNKDGRDDLIHAYAAEKVLLATREEDGEPVESVKLAYASADAVRDQAAKKAGFRARRSRSLHRRLPGAGAAAERESCPVGATSRKTSPLTLRAVTMAATGARAALGRSG